MTAAMIALVLLTASAVGLLTYRTVEAVLLPRALDRLHLRAELMATQVAAAVQSAPADVLGFRRAVALYGMMRARLAGGVDPVDGTSFAQWRDRMASRFVAELAAKPLYAQFRIIGVADGGRELLRVDRSGPGGAVRVVPEAELRRQGDRDYVKTTIERRDGELYVSPIELNQEDGRIEVPHMPVLRAATPVYAPDGTPFGVVIINLDLRPVFDRLPAAAGGRVFVVNAQGDYLVHPDPARVFGFELGAPYRVQDDFPGLAAALGQNAVEPRIIANRDGARFAVALAPVQLAQGPRVAVLQTVPQGTFLAATRALRDASLIAGLGAVLVAIVLAIILAQSMTRPLVQITRAVEGFARGQPMAVPTGASGEIGVLARAFERMSRDVEDHAAAIRRNAEIFDIIMHGMADAVTLLDETGKLVYANPAALVLVEPGVDVNAEAWQAAMQRFHADGVTPFRVEELPSSRAVRGETVEHVEMVLRGRDGDMRRIVGSARPIRDDAGALKGAVLISRDVTELTEIERQLRQSQKMDSIGQLTGGVAHDFNNILTVITGTVELLADAAAGQPRLLDLARKIDDAATRGAALTRQLLAFARIQPLEPRDTDINALVRDTAGLLRPTLGEHVEIEPMLAPAAWRVMIDPDQLSAALINLALNARDAMAQGGRLTLETGNVELDEAYQRANPEARPGAYVMIAVSDTGAGIPAAIRDKVFDPFFTTKKVGRGTGLGLSMVYGFVKQSGGHIKIYSEEGHGTTVKLYLPRSADHAVAPSPAAHEPPAGGRETILVVEDDELVRTHVVAQLESLGYTTLAASHGAEALALVDAGARFDLLFTDVMMPGGMNGRQLAEAVAQRRPAVRVLYTSGYTENAIVHHGRLDPGVALLNKPYRKADLARKLREALASKPNHSA